MSEPKKINVREELTKMIIQKAQEDPDFRKFLLEEPKKALEQFKLRVPDFVDLRVVEETGNVCYLVLPPAPPRPKEEKADRPEDPKTVN